MSVWTPDTTGNTADDIRTLIARLLAAQTAAVTWVSDYLPSAARTTTTLGSSITIGRAKTILFRLKVTAYTAGNVTLQIADAGNSDVVIVSQASTYGVTGSLYSAFGSLALSNTRVNSSEYRALILVPTLKLRILHGTADSITYSVDYALIP
jgi:hypothetical protein